MIEQAKQINPEGEHRCPVHRTQAGQSLLCPMRKLTQEASLHDEEVCSVTQSHNCTDLFPKSKPGHVYLSGYAAK